jgi:hypothetical protein
MPTGEGLVSGRAAPTPMLAPPEDEMREEPCLRASSHFNFVDAPCPGAGATRTDPTQSTPGGLNQATRRYRLSDCRGRTAGIGMGRGRRRLGLWIRSPRIRGLRIRSGIGRHRAHRFLTSPLALSLLCRWCLWLCQQLCRRCLHASRQRPISSPAARFARPFASSALPIVTLLFDRRLNPKEMVSRRNAA